MNAIEKSSLRRRIPVVALIPLAVAACGDDEASDAGGAGPITNIAPGTGTPTDVETVLTQVTEIICQGYADCQPEYFSYYYSSLADCVSAFMSDSDTLTAYAQTGGQDCIDALLAYASCLGNNSSCYSYTYDGYTYQSFGSQDACDGLYDSLDVACANSTSEDGGGTPPSDGCSNTCEYAFDGDCDDGGPDSDYSYCAYGTDCGDCGPR